MSQIDLKEDIRPVTEFRAQAAAMIQRVRETKRALVLTQRGRSAAVVVDVEEYQRMAEELELLRDLYLAEKQIAEDGGVAHSEVRGQVLQSLP